MTLAVRMAGMLIVWLLGSCAAFEDEPEELLRQTISSWMAEDNFRFEGSSQVKVSDVEIGRAFQFVGEVRGHNEILIKPASDSVSASGVHRMNGMLRYAKVNQNWTAADDASGKSLNPLYTVNPLIHAEHLNRSAKDVVIEQAGAQTDDGTVLLRATIAEDRLAEQLKEQIRREHEEVIRNALYEARSANNPELAEQLNRFAEKAGQQLKEILNTLTIRADYRLAVEKRNRILKRLDVVSSLNYELDGKSRKEVIRTTYEMMRPS